MNISDEVVRLLHRTSEGEMNLYRIAQELQKNPGAIRRVLNTLVRSDMVEETIICPHCGSDIHRKNVEKRYSLRIVMKV